MPKFVRAIAEKWPTGYSGHDGIDSVHIQPGGVLRVSDAKAAQLAEDFPGMFEELSDKDGAAAVAAASLPAEPAPPAKPSKARKETE